MIRLPLTRASMPGRLLALAAFALAWSVTPGLAQDAQTALPPAHLSYVDGRVVLDREAGPEDAEVSTPLVPGDRIRTEDGRAEILFGDGSLVQLDAETMVDLLSDARLRLLQGRLAIVATLAQAERLQVDTPEGSVAFQSAGEYRVRLFDSDGRGTLELSVVRGNADLASDRDRVAVAAGERSWARTGEAPAYPVRFNAASLDAFDRWALDRAMDRRGGGASAHYVPATLRPYAGVLDTYGSWDYESTYGYVWYPRVEVGWRPYYSGRWRHYGRFGWTWVGGGAWGWPTHHYGRWGISGAGAWFWIPGATWGPAWVSWAMASDYVSWCPIGYDNRPVIGWGYNVGYGSRHGRGHDPWHAWTVVPRQHFGGYRVVSGVAVDGRGLGGPHGRPPSFVVQDRPPVPPRPHAVADRGAYGLGVAVPRGSGAGSAKGGAHEPRPGLDRTRADRRAPAGAVPAGPATAQAPSTTNARGLQPAPGGSSYRSFGSRIAPRPGPGIERTPEDLAGDSRSAIARGSRYADRLPGDVGARPMPAAPGATPDTTARGPVTATPGWRADQVPVYRGGRLDPSTSGSAPPSPTPGHAAPGAWRAGPPTPATRGGYAVDDVGRRAPYESPRQATPRNDGNDAIRPVTPGSRTRADAFGVPDSPRSPSSMPAYGSAPPPSSRMAPPPSPPPSPPPPPRAAPPQSAPPRQAPPSQHGGSAVPRGGPPPSRHR